MTGLMLHFISHYFVFRDWILLTSFRGFIEQLSNFWVPSIVRVSYSNNISSSRRATIQIRQFSTSIFPYIQSSYCNNWVQLHTWFSHPFRNLSPKKWFSLSLTFWKFWKNYIEAKNILCERVLVFTVLRKRTPKCDSTLLNFFLKRFPCLGNLFSFLQRWRIPQKF